MGIEKNKIETKGNIRNLNEIKSLMHLISKGSTNKNKNKIKEFFYKGDFNQRGKPTEEILLNLQNSLINFKCPIDAFFALTKFNISDDNRFTEGTNEIIKVKIPIFLLHGKDDSKVDVKLKYKEIEIFDKNKINYEYYFYNNAGHYVICDEFYDILKKMKIFLKC